MNQRYKLYICVCPWTISILDLKSFRTVEYLFGNNKPIFLRVTFLWVHSIENADLNCDIEECVFLYENVNFDIFYLSGAILQFEVPSQGDAQGTGLKYSLK